MNVVTFSADNNRLPEEERSWHYNTCVHLWDPGTELWSKSAVHDLLRAWAKYADLHRLNTVRVYGVFPLGFAEGVRSWKPRTLDTVLELYKPYIRAGAKGEGFKFNTWFPCATHLL